jgi:hypothetical protein
VDVVIGDGFLHVTVAVSTITLMRFDSGDFLGYVTFGEGGQATFPTAGDKRLIVDAIAARKESAVLKFSTK